jgi:hypothetical protein
MRFPSADAVVAVSAIGLLLSACSNPLEDVRVTLCKDLVHVKRGDGVTWTEVTTETPGYEDAMVRLRFSQSGRDGSATCFFAYNAVDDTALALSDPLSSYATSPSRMLLDGRALSRRELAIAVKDAMLKQGRALIEDVRNSLKRSLCWLMT